MILDKIGYSYNDLTIIPAKTSSIKSRSECNCFVDGESKLPIFAAPMTSVVNEHNYYIFEENGITPIIPRSVNFDTRIELMSKQKWIALSLKEFEDLFIRNIPDRIVKFSDTYNICIDVANGHMQSVYHLCSIAKQKAFNSNYKLCLMIGNIANPETFKYIYEEVIYNEGVCEECAIDYIRVGIGGGSGCTTTSNVGIHYPQASLIEECYIYKNHMSRNNVPKIIADGGIRNYSDVIKALALGADYVMIGSVLAQCVESAGVKTKKMTSKNVPIIFPISRYKDFSVAGNGEICGYYTEEFKEKQLESWKHVLDECEQYGPDDSRYLSAYVKYNERLKDLSQKKHIGYLDVIFFGMASADGQRAISGKKTKTAEGITKRLPVKYTIQQWTNNMISYLRSAMSYTNHNKLDSFIGNCDLIINSQTEINSVNK